jgi:hypothetical protein
MRVLFHQIRPFEYERLPPSRRHVAPYARVEGLARGLYRPVDIRLVTFRDAGKSFSGDRRNRVERLSGYGINKFSAYVGSRLKIKSLRFRKVFRICR